MAYNDIYRLRIYQRQHGSQVVNVLHFVSEDPAGLQTGQDLANDFLSKMTATLRGRAANQMAFETIEVQSIVPFNGGLWTAAFAGGTVGNAPTSSSTAVLAEVVTIYTSRGGRRGRGRIYLAGAGTSTSELQAGVWTSAQTTRTTALATALATNYMKTAPVSGWTLGVWSKVLAGPEPPWPTSAFARATALTVRTICRTQRRRQVGVGR